MFNFSNLIIIGSFVFLIVTIICAAKSNEINKTIATVCENEETRSEFHDMLNLPKKFTPNKISCMLISINLYM